MGRYVGECFAIPLEKGGFSHNKNIDTIAPEDMVHPSRNIWLNEGGIRKRGGTTPVDVDPMSGSPEVNGLFGHRLANGNQHIVRTTADGKLWKSNIATIKTGLGLSRYPYFSQWGDDLIIANGSHIPMWWNGTDASATNFTNVPTDWTGINHPKQIVLHGRGNSMRGWGIGCPLNPKNIYVSTNDDPTDFTQATVLVFQIETGDGSGVVAGIEYGDRLLVFSKNRAFVFNDDSTNTDNWGYTAGQWEGGVAHHGLLVKTPNDLVAMMENGEIYSISTAQTYGDYKAASLTRPSFMYEWIKEYLNLAHIAKFHAIYDPTIRAIKFFVIRTGSSTIDTCLCYFIDRPPEKAWVVLDNQDHESGYSAVSAAMVRVSAGVWKLYTGSYNGKVWKLGEVNRNDNGEGFQARYRTPSMTFGDVRESKRYDKVRIVAVREGACSATLTWWIDGQLKNQKDFEFATSGSMLGEFILGVSLLGGTNILEQYVRLGCSGKRLQLEIKNNTANEAFFFSQLLIDFLPLGREI